MDNFKKNKILIRPIITEKMMQLKDKPKRNGDPLNQYAFEVTTDSNKIEIKKAVEAKYNVKVLSVRTLNVKGKKRVRFTKSGRFSGQTRDWKKAMVTVEKDQTLDFIEGV